MENQEDCIAVIQTFVWRSPAAKVQQFSLQNTVFTLFGPRATRGKRINRTAHLGRDLWELKERPQRQA